MNKWIKAILIFLAVMLTLLLILITYGKIVQSQWKMERELMATRLSDMAEEELIKKISSDDPKDMQFYSLTIDELMKRGAAASEAAPALAKAIERPFRNSVIASEALFAMGEDAILSLPILLGNLSNKRAEVRLYSIMVIGRIGENALCSIPTIAPFLWDSDAEVRGVAASAIATITGINLVDEDDLIDSSNDGIAIDVPEGVISGSARNWWTETGSSMSWPVEGCVINK
jgi:hypothetical protein